MTEFPHPDFAAERETRITSATLRNWFVSLGKTDAERADIAAWIDSRMKRPGRPKLNGRPSILSLKVQCRLLSEKTTRDHARAEFADLLTDNQINAAFAKNIDGKMTAALKESSGNKLLPDDSS